MKHDQRPLFSAAALTLPDSRTEYKHGAAITSTARRRNKARAAAGGRRSRCADVLGAIRPGEALHVVSAGEWSAHDMIAHIAEQIGPAALWFMTWSISETGVRGLLQSRAAGHITTIRAVVDWRVLVRNRDATQLCRAQADAYRVAPCHAKVYLLQGPNMHVSIVGSANLTNNPRLECSVITEDREVFAFYRDAIEATLARATHWEDL